MNNNDTEKNTQVTKKVIQINTNNNTQNQEQTVVKKVVKVLNTNEESHDMNSLSNVHDPEKFRELNNSLKTNKTSKGKSALITIGSLIAVVVLVFVAFNAVDIGKKIVNYFNPTEVDYVKEMANKINNSSNLRILNNDTTYFVFLPSFGKLNSKFVVKLDVYKEAVSSKMESFSYNNEMNLFIFNGLEYYTTKEGSTYNGLNFKLDESIKSSMYKYEDGEELIILLLMKLRDRNVAIYFNNKNGEVSNINGFYVDDEASVAVNEELVFTKDGNTLSLGEKRLARVV